MTTPLRTAALLHDPESARRGDRDGLSLALIDARNRTLRWLACFESSPFLAGGEGHPAQPLRLAGRAGWFQEYWVSRHVQRLRGEQADPRAPRLASIEPQADAWFEPGPGGSVDAPGPDAQTVRDYLANTLEITLDLLHGSAESDDALHAFRLSLLHEDRLAETFAVAAQWLGVEPREGDGQGPLGPPARAVREPLWLPARRFALGSAPGGLVPANERWAHEVAVPEFEIDAQAVTWAQWVEFAEDGGYDDPLWWTPEGWQWVQDQGRRAPRGVEQLRGGVLVQRFGQMRRAPAGQAASHLSWYEAQAWCAWAGRRLPTEVEWELAATTAAARGFVWGDVREWVAGSARPWPGRGEGCIAGFSPVPAPASRRVLRGASCFTAPRGAHPRARRFVAADRDELFCGFRSCAA